MMTPDSNIVQQYEFKSVPGAEIKLANPRGFCAGVDRAIDIVNRAALHFDLAHSQTM